MMLNANEFRVILALHPTGEARLHSRECRMRRHRNAKIVATLGPASSSAEVIRDLHAAGADVFRLNFSHGTHDDHKQRFNIIRQLERETGRPIGVLMDLQGPKLRVGTFGAGRILLKKGERFGLDLDGGPGDQTRVSMPHPEVFAALSPGVELLLDDGKVRLVVEKASPREAVTRVAVEGYLSDRKGVSVVGAILPLSALTVKDQRDLAFALDLGADWIALSFIQRAEDIDELRAIVGKRAAIIAKLEKPSAVSEEHLQRIVALSDAVMVARGDLGVEMPPEKVPPIQRRIIRTCRKLGKPSVVATQMLESMIEAPTPTRAEASDVASAIYHGADAVMLSAESASGKYPLEAVTIMDRIIMEAEQDSYWRSMADTAHPGMEKTIPGVICAGLRAATTALPVAVTVTYTRSGSTSLLAARERLPTSILSMATQTETARRLTLAWGIHSVQAHEIGSVDEMIEHACQTALKEDFAARGDIIAVTAGTPFGISGTTNMLKILTVP
jgi:pyruvate kinase